MRMVMVCSRVCLLWFEYLCVVVLYSQKVLGLLWLGLIAVVYFVCDGGCWSWVCGCVVM